MRGVTLPFIISYKLLRFKPASFAILEISPRLLFFTTSTRHWTKSSTSPVFRNVVKLSSNHAWTYSGFLKLSENELSNIDYESMEKSLKEEGKKFIQVNA